MPLLWRFTLCILVTMVTETESDGEIQTVTVVTRIGSDKTCSIGDNEEGIFLAALKNDLHGGRKQKMLPLQ